MRDRTGLRQYAAVVPFSSNGNEGDGACPHHMGTEAAGAGAVRILTAY